jgi:hypothetical protein
VYVQCKIELFTAVSSKEGYYTQPLWKYFIMMLIFVIIDLCLFEYRAGLSYNIYLQYYVIHSYLRKHDVTSAGLGVLVSSWPEMQSIFNYNNGQNECE